MKVISWYVTNDRIIRNINELVVEFKFDPKIAKLIKLSYVACMNLIKKEENPDYFRFMCIICYNSSRANACIINDIWQNKHIYFDETLCMIHEGQFRSNTGFFLTEESYTNIYNNIFFNLFEQLDKLVESYEK